MVERAKVFLDTVTAIFDKYDAYIPISIFKVPTSITEANPEAYVPKLVGLGPLHHMRSELQQMQMYKVMEARRFHHGFQSVDFHTLVEVLKEIAAPSVRASYNMYLEITNDVLACIIAIDGLFLFDLLSCYVIKKKATSSSALANSSFLSQLADSAGRILAQEATVRDALLLENQVPILVLKTILIVESPEFELVSKILPEILVGFCRFVSPFEKMVRYSPYKALKRAHLLDLLYHMIMLEHKEEEEEEEEEEELQLLQEFSCKVKSKIKELGNQENEPSTRISLQRWDVVEHFFDVSKEFAPLPMTKLIGLAQRLLGLPWSELGSSISLAITKEPPAEEILIPRASELHEAGVKFFASDHITRIKFEPNRLYLHLPSIRLSGNSEVIIRNLVAYEAMIKSETEPLILTRYVDIMSGLIQTSEDVRVLKNHKIVKLQSINEEQVAKVFNEMSKSVQSTNTENVDQEIEGVKKYYYDLWKVKASKFIKRGMWIAGNWCKVFAVVLVLLLMGIQAFCSVYGCHRFSFMSSNSQDQQGLRVLSLRSYM